MTSGPDRPADAALMPRASSGLLGRRLRDLAKGSPLTCPPSTEIAEAAVLMSARGAGSIVVVEPKGSPSVS